MLKGKRLLITGVLTKGSIAYTVAERAQQEGAEIVLTGFGRTWRMTERAAARLPEPPDILELDVNNPAELRGAGRRAARALGRRRRGPSRDRLRAGRRARRASSLTAPAESAEQAFRTSAYSFKALAEALQPLMDGGGSLVGDGLRRQQGMAGLRLDGRGEAALESVSRYLARDLGEQGVRVNLISAGPVETPAAQGIPGFEQLAGLWGKQAPLSWDTSDPGPVADAVLFLLSDLSRGVTGEILHVDGGFHAMGAPLRP